MAANPAPHIPDHELLRRIGRGSYGEVWLARSTTGAYRAVKVIYRDSFEHERPYEREFAGIKKFEPISRESETQVDILHVGRNDAEGLFYYVMELADDQKTGTQINPDDYSARTLRSELYQRGRLPLQECLDIGMQLTTALEHLHGSGLIHRDIKPSNIVFVDGTPKLADVGLVTTVDATRSFVGTEGYIPADGPGTPQTDLYGLGKVLYEISTGRDRLDFPELPTNLKDHPERDALVQLNEVILKACDEDRTKRYQSANDMYLDLVALKAGKPLVRTRPVPVWKLLAGFVLLTAVLALGLMIEINRSRSTHTPRAPVQNPQSSTSNSIHGSDSKFQPVINPSELAPTPGLVSWWKADGDALDSAGKNNGSLIEGVGFDAGRNGQAFFFNGSTACVSVPNSPDWAFGTNDFSIPLWAKFSSAFPSQALLACEEGYGDVKKWVFRLRDGRLQWHMIVTNNPVDLGSAVFSPIIGQWYHLAITRAGNKFHFFTNAIVASVETWSNEVPRVGAPLTIGNAWGAFGFCGLLDDIRIYNRALSPRELETLETVAQVETQVVEDVVVIGTRKYQRSERMINTSFVGDPGQANLAVLANGNFLATWHQGLHWHCYGQVFNQQGDPVGSAFLLNVDEPNGWQWGPSPAPLPDGGFIAAWGDQVQQINNYTGVQRFDSAGAPISPGLSLDFPDWTAVASYTNGDFVMAGTYAVGPKATNDLPIFARRFNAAGATYGASFQVSTTTHGVATASTTYGNDGRFAFAWPSHTRNAMVRAYRYNELSPFGPEFPANTVATCDSVVSARYNSSNELVVVWRSPHGGLFANAVCVRRFDSNLVAETNEWKVNETTHANQWPTSLSIGTNDEALITWDSTISKSSRNIYARLLNRKGDPIGHEFRVNQFAKGSHTLGWEACLHTAILGNGNFVVGWVGDGASGNGIYLTLFKLLDDKTESLKKP